MSELKQKDDTDAKRVEPIRVIRDVTGNYSVAGADANDVIADARCDSCCCQGHCAFQHGPKGSSNITSLMSVPADVHDANHLYTTDVVDEADVIDDSLVSVLINDEVHTIITSLETDFNLDPVLN